MAKVPLTNVTVALLKTTLRILFFQIYSFSHQYYKFFSTDINTFVESEYKVRFIDFIGIKYCLTKLNDL